MDEAMLGCPQSGVIAWPSNSRSPYLVFIRRRGIVVTRQAPRGQLGSRMTDLDSAAEVLLACEQFLLLALQLFCLQQPGVQSETARA